VVVAVTLNQKLSRDPSRIRRRRRSASSLSVGGSTVKVVSSFFIERHRVPRPGYLPNALDALSIDMNRDVAGRGTDLRGDDEVEEAVENVDDLLRRARVVLKGTCD